MNEKKTASNPGNSIPTVPWGRQRDDYAAAPATNPSRRLLTSMPPGAVDAEEGGGGGMVVAANSSRRLLTPITPGAVGAEEGGDGMVVMARVSSSSSVEEMLRSSGIGLMETKVSYSKPKKRGHASKGGGGAPTGEGASTEAFKSAATAAESSGKRDGREGSAARKRSAAAAGASSLAEAAVGGASASSMAEAAAGGAPALPLAEVAAGADASTAVVAEEEGTRPGVVSVLLSHPPRASDGAPGHGSDGTSDASALDEGDVVVSAYAVEDDPDQFRLEEQIEHLNRVARQLQAEREMLHNARPLATAVTVEQADARQENSSLGDGENGSCKWRVFSPRHRLKLFISSALALVVIVSVTVVATSRNSGIQSTTRPTFQPSLPEQPFTPTRPTQPPTPTRPTQLPTPTRPTQLPTPARPTQQPIGTTMKSLFTTFNYTHCFEGHMFDMIAKRGLALVSMEIHTTSMSEFPIEIWTKKGQYMGSETDQGAWEKIGETSITGAGRNNLTAIPVDTFAPVTVRTGARQAFYVASPGLNVCFQEQRADGGNGATLINYGDLVYENSDLQLNVGTGVAYLFNWFGFPNVFNGKLEYALV